MTLFDRIIRRIARRVTITCDPRAFTFSGPAGTQTLRTFLSFKKSQEGAIVVAVGTEVPDSSEEDLSVFRVDLFSPNLDTRLPSRVSSEELLSLYLRQEVRLVVTATPHIPIVRPVVRFVNAQTLDSALEGKANEILRRVALIGIGAREIEFLV
jgi:hypothetical protein